MCSNQARRYFAGLALSFLMVGMPQSVEAQRRDTLHVLLIGNSYLYYHNTPKILQDIAKTQPGPMIQTKLVAHGGWSLADHWDDSTTQAVLGSRKWDWVVFNEQSALGNAYLVDGKYRVHSSEYLAEYAQRFAVEVKRAGANMAIIGHWSTRSAPARDDAALHFAFDSVASSLSIKLVPAGIAWQNPEIVNAQLDLYDRDGSHPSELGSYFLANLLYGFLTNKSPVGAPGMVRGPYIEDDDGKVFPDSIITLVNLPASKAAALQQVAWNTYLQAIREGGYLPVSRPKDIDLPALPSQRRSILQSDLLGLWRGSTSLYPVSRAPILELRVEAQGNSLLGKLHRVLGSAADASKDIEVSIRVENGIVTIIDPKGPNGGTVRYQGVLSGDKLLGIAEFLIPNSRIYGIGRWELSRVE